jgi:hypothetical protein
MTESSRVCRNPDIDVRVRKGGRLQNRRMGLIIPVRRIQEGHIGGAVRQGKIFQRDPEGIVPGRAREYIG